jgi:hypothetical protein
MSLVDLPPLYPRPVPDTAWLEQVP